MKPERTLSKTDNKMITIETFSDPILANTFKAKLESEGIYCFLQDEITIGINNFFSNAIGNIRMQVREQDLPKIKEIFKNNVSENQISQVDDLLKCKKCNSQKVELHKEKNRISILTILLFGFPLFYSNYYYVCQKCQNSWKKEKSILITVFQFFFYIFIVFLLFALGYILFF